MTAVGQDDAEGVVAPPAVVRLESGGKREAILRAAIEVFAARGYGGASLRSIGAAAGVEKGHLTYYFPTKDELLFEVVDDLHQRFVDGIAVWPGPERGEPEARLRGLLEAHVALVCDLRRQTRVAYENFRFLSADRRAVVIGKRDAYEHHLAELVDDCRPGGRIADTPTFLLTKVVLGILNWPYHWFSPEGGHARDDVARVIAMQARSALAPNPSHGYNIVLPPTPGRAKES